MTQELSKLVLAIITFMVVIGFTWLKVIFIRLEKFHPETYLKIGSPGLIFNGGLKTGFPVLRFLVGRQYVALKDTSLTKWCDLYLCYLFLYASIFIAYAVYAD